MKMHFLRFGQIIDPNEAFDAITSIIEHIYFLIHGISHLVNFDRH